LRLGLSIAKMWKLIVVRRLIPICAIVLLAIVAAPASATPPPKAQIMIVGVAHLVARRDVHNSALTDSPLSPRRQAQIADLVAHLARFHPTKVLIEATFGDQKYPDEYRRYLAGQFTLGASEIYQYGFNLAARSGNTTVYPIDTWGPSIYDDNSLSGKRIDAYFPAHFKDVKNSASDAFERSDDALELRGTYLDDLRFLNTDSSIKASASWYSTFAGMGRDAGNAGATYVAQWYTRNCFVFSNILSVIHPGDRVVLFMGQGHEYLLRELVRLNPDLIDVDPLQYLK
jgi:hypothetical protein